MTTLISLLLMPIVLPCMLVGWLFRFLSRNRMLALGIGLLIVGMMINVEGETPEVSAPEVSQSTYDSQVTVQQTNYATDLLTEQIPSETSTDYSAFALCDQTGYNWDMVDPVQASLPWSYRNGGVCRTLKEDASVVVVFLEDDQSDWTDWEMRNYLDNMISPALDYIEYNAYCYGYDITLEQIHYVDNNGNLKSTEYYGSVRDLNHNGGADDILGKSANSLGYSSAEDMLWDARNYSGDDQIAYVFVLDKPGRSYSRRYGGMGDYMEYSVLFTSQNGYQVRADVVAHEVLHQFGAEDIYAEGTERVNRARMAQRVCPNEIFLNYQQNLYDNQISDFTAYTVGWLDYFPDLYRDPAWWS